jgi:hypothetical protein
MKHFAHWLPQNTNTLHLLFKVMHFFSQWGNTLFGRRAAAAILCIYKSAKRIDMFWLVAAV